MKLTVTEKFNLFELFVHGNEAIQGLDKDDVAEAINELLIDSGWEIYPPDGIDRFTVGEADGGKTFSERCYTVDQVKDYLPVDAVEALEEINRMSIDLSSRAVVED